MQFYRGLRLTQFNIQESSDMTRVEYRIIREGLAEIRAAIGELVSGVDDGSLDNTDAVFDLDVIAELATDLADSISRDDPLSDYVYEASPPQAGVLNSAPERSPYITWEDAFNSCLRQAEIWKSRWCPIAPPPRAPDYLYHLWP